MSAQETHWTSGAPKWAAVLVLGAASTTAIGWAIRRGGETWRTPARASVSPQMAFASPAMQQQPRPPAEEQATQRPMPQQPNAPAQMDLRSVAASPGSSSSETPRTTTPMRKLINVNTAGQGELELLPGIGPALAKRIIEHRTSKGGFRRIDDLDAVKGIGPKILERLRAQVTVE